MKKLFFCLAQLCWMSCSAQVPVLDYSGPLQISAGGTYSGNFRSTGSEPAILVTTSEPVIIVNSTVVGSGSAVIQMYGYSSVTLQYCNIYADVNAQGQQRGRAINDYRPRQLTMEHCYIEKCRGVLIDHGDDTQFGSSVVIRYNKGKNMTKANEDGSNGGEHCQFLQFNSVPGLKNSVVSWNEILEEPGNSWVEDNINVYASGGTEGDPLIIENNFIDGAYPLDLVSPFSGSGITVEESSSYVIARNNQVLSCMNSCMNIAGGDHIIYTGNRIISASLLPDGSHSLLYWAGCAIFNSNNWLATDSITGNTIGYVRWDDAGNYYPVPGRHDENSLRGQIQNQMPSGLNTYLPDPITAETEDAEYVVWKQKLADNNIKVGSTPTPL